MSQCSIIVNTAPLLVPVLAYFWLKESIGSIDVVALLCGFIGWVLINVTKTKTNNQHQFDENMHVVGIILCVVALIGRVFVPIMLRLMSAQLHAVIAPAYFSYAVLLSGLTWLIISPSSFNFDKLTKRDIILFFISGMWNYGEQRFLTLAMKLGKASILFPITYINIALLLIVDLLVFKYHFEMIYFIGFWTIIISVLTPIMIRANQQKKS